MIRNALLALAAVVVIGAGFVITFMMWRHTDEARAFALGVPYTNFNWKTVNAQNRGCNACHADHLAADVNRLVVGRAKPELHGIFATSYDIPMRVGRLPDLPQHTDIARLRRQHSLPASARGRISNMGGNCNSCHGTTLNGKHVLFDDENRYYILNGVKTIQTPAFSQPSSQIIRDLEIAAKAD